MPKPTKLEEQFESLRVLHEKQTKRVAQLTQAETQTAARYQKFSLLVSANEKSQHQVTRDRVAVETMVVANGHGLVGGTYGSQAYFHSMAHQREHAAVLERTLRKLRRLQAGYLASYNQARLLKDTARLILQRLDITITSLRARQEVNKQRAAARLEKRKREASPAKEA